MFNDVEVLEPMVSSELNGHALDLGRPELTELMERYVPMSPRKPEQLLGPPTAVIVTRWPGQEEPVKNELEGDGWAVEVCDGPARTICPLMRGESCALRESADVAVVFMSPAERTASVPRVRCAADHSSPGVVALEGRIDPPRFSGSTAMVGALRGPGAVVSTVSALIASGGPAAEP